MITTARALGLAAASAVLVSASGAAASAADRAADRGDQGRARVAMLLERSGAAVEESCVARAVTPSDGVCVVEVSCDGYGTQAAKRASSLSEAWWSLCEATGAPAE